MSRDRLPWLLVVGLVALLAFGQCGRSADEAVALDRARAAEDSLAVLEPLVDRLMAEAARADTVLVQVTDTLRITIETVRVEYREVATELRATLDSLQVVQLDNLEALHATEVAALEEQVAQTLLWGQSWKDAAEALEAENTQLRLWGESWERAYRSSQGQNRWLRIGQAASAGLGFLAGRL